MIYTPTALKDCWVITPQLIQDERGFFMEAYQQQSFNQEIEPVEFIQDNEVHSHYCLLYTSPSPRDLSTSRMPSSA